MQRTLGRRSKYQPNTTAKSPQNPTSQTHGIACRSQRPRHRRRSARPARRKSAPTGATQIPMMRPAAVSSRIPLRRPASQPPAATAPNALSNRPAHRSNRTNQCSRRLLKPIPRGECDGAEDDKPSMVMLATRWSGCGLTHQVELRSAEATGAAMFKVRIGSPGAQPDAGRSVNSNAPLKVNASQAQRISDAGE